MPQPYKGHADTTFNSGVLLQRPRLAAHIAVIAAIGGEIDLWLALVLIEILESEASEATVAMYLSIINSGVRKEVIRAAANAKLDQSERKELEDLLKLAKSDTRNDLVHGSWGIASDEPDALLLDDHRFRLRTAYTGHSVVEFLKETWGRTPAQFLDTFTRFCNTAVENEKVVSSKRLIYREDDFIAVEKAMKNVVIALSNFKFGLMERRSKALRQRLSLPETYPTAPVPPNQINPTE
jgi:hypothetical protein